MCVWGGVYRYDAERARGRAGMGGFNGHELVLGMGKVGVCVLFSRIWLLDEVGILRVARQITMSGMDVLHRDVIRDDVYDGKHGACLRMEKPCAGRHCPAYLP